MDEGLAGNERHDVIPMPGYIEDEEMTADRLLRDLGSSGSSAGVEILAATGGRPDALC